ncbi:MAG TPA: deaminase [Streptosporangiaceae bacterium]|nr:deaminase [Streptosporangiaceae bacterium]
MTELAPGRNGQLNGADRHWLGRAIELSRRCPPSASAYCVGAVLVSGGGAVLATGFSRERDPYDHAEEAALATVGPAGGRLPSATLYSSLEPCQVRASRPRPCAELIIAAGLHRVVIAWLEPPVLAPGGGAQRLRGAGVTVLEIPELAAQARDVNAAVLGAARRKD